MSESTAQKPICVPPLCQTIGMAKTLQSKIRSSNNQIQLDVDEIAKENFSAKSEISTVEKCSINREIFLMSHKRPERYGYKRYQGLPLRYAGGKSLAVGHIIEHFPKKIDFLASPFMGGGSLEIACARELGIEVKAYDIFDILTNYWNVQLQTPTKLANKIREWAPNKKTYNQVKARLKEHWDGTRPIGKKLDLAAHYWFNHNLSYGPGFLGWMSKIYEEKDRFTRLVNKVEDFSCKGLSVEQGSYADTIERHKKDFLYCDPPYYLDGDSKMFRGIYPQRNFPVHHRGFNHAELCELLHNHKGGFVLSYNDCKTIRKWYSKFKIVEVSWQYTLGQGETRIGKNRIEKGNHTHIKGSHELLIVKEA